MCCLFFLAAITGRPPRGPYMSGVQGPATIQTFLSVISMKISRGLGLVSLVSFSLVDRAYAELRWDKLVKLSWAHFKLCSPLKLNSKLSPSLLVILHGHQENTYIVAIDAVQLSKTQEPESGLITPFPHQMKFILYQYVGNPAKMNYESSAQRRHKIIRKIWLALFANQVRKWLATPKNFI